MEDKDNRIDLGEWTVPSKWTDIDLATFSEIERYYEEKEKDFDMREVLHILTHKTMDEINMLPAEFLDIILEKLSFLQKQPEVGEAKNEIMVDGEKYFINIMEKLKTGEYVAFDSALKNDRHDYASMLAILCRKQGEVYDSKYEAELFELRKEMWNKQPVVNILPLVSFFLQLWYVQEMFSQLYSLVEEAVNHTQQSINSSHKIGVFKRRSLNSQMKKLRKLLESSRNT